MKKLAISLAVLCGVVMSAHTMACDSVHQDMTSASTATNTMVATATPAPVPVK